MKQIIKKATQFWWIFILVAFVPAMIKSRIPDSDTFFLAATGKYIVQHGMVPTVNPFVIHEGFEIIVQQWLFDVLIYGLYSTWGNVGLYVYLLFIAFVTMILLYKYFGLFSNSAKLKGIIMLVSGVIYVGFSTARPTSLSFPIFIALLYCVEQYRRTNKLKYLAPLPALSLLEVNLHAAMWPMLFVVMLPYIFPYTIPKKENIKTNTKKWFCKNKWLFFTLVLMVAAGFLNPNGFTGMTYVIKSYVSATDGLAIKELSAPATNSYLGIIVMITGAIFILYLYKNRNKLKNPEHDKQEKFTRIYMTLGVLLLASMHIRNMWYLPLGAFPVVLLTLNDWAVAKEEKEKTYKPIKFIAITLSCAVLIISAYFINEQSVFSDSTNNDSTYAPVKAADYLDATSEEKRIVLYTEFNNGAYMEWRGYKVYMDARPELFQKAINGQEDIYSEYVDVYKGNIDYTAFLSKYNFTHLVVSDKSLFQMYLSFNEDYQLVVNGNGYALYENVSK